MTSLPPDHPPIRRSSLGPSSLESPRSGWFDVMRWAGAGALVLLAHAAGAYVIHNAQPDDHSDGIPPAAMVVELALAPIAPDAEDVALAPQAETAKIVEEVVEPEQPDLPDPVEPEEVQEPELPQPDVTEAEKPEVVAPKPIEKPKPVEKVKVEKPKPVKKVQEKLKPKKAVRSEETRKAAAPQVNAEAGETFAANRNGQSAGAPGLSPAKWSSKVQAHLERQRRFLQRKMGSKDRGLVQLSFTIDPSGNVLSARIAGSSGNPELDQLTLEMARRASPVPAPPAALAKARMPISVPIRFR